MPDNTTVNVCFHGIGEPGRAMEPGEDRYWVPVDDFHRILHRHLPLAGHPRVAEWIRRVDLHPRA